MYRTLLLPVLALAAVLPAQTRPGVDVTLATADAVGVHANRVIDGARARTVIERALLLQARDGRTAAASSLARRSAQRTPRGGGVGAAFAWRGIAAGGDSAGTLGGSPLAVGAQHYAMVLTSARGVTGDLVIVFGGNGRNGGGARASVAVGAENRSFVADGSAHRARIEDVTIGGRGVRVDVQIAGHAGGSREASGFAAELEVHFVPDRAGGPSCEVLAGQRSCAEGGVLRGSVDTAGRMPVLQLGLQGALPNAIGVSIVSPNGRTFPIPGTSCIFFATPIVADVFTTDANGDARTRMRFPARPGGSFFVHQGTILVSPRGVRLGTSNSLEVRCD